MTIIEELQKQIVIPEILNEFPVIDYMRRAVQMHDDAMKPYADLQLRYITLKRFLEFTVRLHKHNGYGSKICQKERMFLERCVRAGITVLEDVVKGLRQLEQQLQQQELKRQQEELYDLFEAPDIESSDTTAPAAVPVPIPVSSAGLPSAQMAAAAGTAAAPARALSDSSSTASRGGVDDAAALQRRASEPNRSLFDRLRVPEAALVLPAAVTPAAAGLSTTAASWSQMTQLSSPLSARVAMNAGRGLAGSGSPAYEAVAEFNMLSGGQFAEQVEGESDILGLSVPDVRIGRCLLGIPINPGQPYVTDFYLPLSVPGGSTAGAIIFPRHDYFVNYAPVLRAVPPQLQMARSAVETNRCFFLHLGIALSLHPFLLQCAFRHFATALLRDKTAPDAVVWGDILPSVVRYADFVDANALIWLWMEEFRPYRICILSGSQQRPCLSTFRTAGVDVSTLLDIIIHCDGQHFTLLLHPSSRRGDAGGAPVSSIVPTLLQASRAVGGVVQEHSLDVRPGHSVGALVQALSR